MSAPLPKEYDVDKDIKALIALGLLLLIIALFIGASSLYNGMSSEWLKTPPNSGKVSPQRPGMP
jgi:hypothetical protein